MSETQYNYYSDAKSYQNEGQQYATSSQDVAGASGAHSTDNQRQQLFATQPTSSTSKAASVASGSQILGGVQTTNSFHSVSSMDSSAEMSKYFPDAQTPSLSPFRHQQGVEGQAQSAATTNTVASANTNNNTVNAGPYIPVSVPTSAQRLPQSVRGPNMAQQRPVRAPGIPSYSSQIEGLSVSQAVVNDVLVDLQTKVINETLQQYHEESSSGSYMEPLAPIYIRAPQPTIILQSDLHRLRAELGNRVRPPVVYRHPGGANQFQQHRFQQNSFQVPQFPAPQQQIPTESYGDYRNMAYANSDEYKATTTCNEYQRENEAQFYNQAEPTVLNDSNFNDNVHRAFNLQGLSTTSFDHHDLPFQSTALLSQFEDKQQGNEDTLIASSQNICTEHIDPMDNLYSRPVRPRQEITFDIDNCISRCFEAHRERVARRRAARQARKSRRQKQTAQPSQQVYYTDQYQAFPTQPIRSSYGTLEQTPWQQLPSDIQQQQTSFDYSNQAPYSYSSTDATVPDDIQYLGSDYYQQQQQQNIPSQYTESQDIYAQSSTTFDYGTGTTQNQIPNYDYQYPYNVENIQQQQTYDYTTGSVDPTTGNYGYTNDVYQTQEPMYVNQGTEQQDVYNYASGINTSYSTAGTDLQQNQATDQITEASASSLHYEQQSVSVPVTQTQEGYGQPTGTYEYTREVHESQQPIYDYKGEEYQTNQIESIDESKQVISLSSEYQDQSISGQAVQGVDSALHDQEVTNTSITSGQVEDIKEIPQSRQPTSDNYSTETFIEQKEKSETMSVNDYIKQFESKSQPQQRGPAKSSDDRQSSRSSKTTPFVVQQGSDMQVSQGSIPTYDLQNYTNETITSETSATVSEEDQRRLLQETSANKPSDKPSEQIEDRSEKEASKYDTNRSLPPPPSLEGADQQQDSIATTSSDFPPPPPPLDHQSKQQRPTRSYPSIIPSNNQASIFTTQAPEQPASGDPGSDDSTAESEELYDLRQCIEKCYAKYRDEWTQEIQAKYEQHLKAGKVHIDQQNLGQQYYDGGEIHCVDAGTQTKSHDDKTRSYVTDQTFDQTAESFDTRPYKSQSTTRDLSTDSRGQTIEYTPPLITQTQQKQAIYDHTLPLPPHLSFNDTLSQTNFDFSAQTTDQPRQYQNIPCDKYEEQQRHRAHSEPPSTQQETVVTVPPVESTETLEQQPKRSASISMLPHEQSQDQLPSFRFLDNGRVYETDSAIRHYTPRIDPKTGLCLVPCPQTQKYAHLPPHLRPEIFCVELPPASALPPPPPPPPPPEPPVQDGRWCVRCCCAPGQSLVKKVVYKQEEEQQQQQHQEESQYDYASVIDQMATTISVRYGNSIMEDTEPYVSGGYNEKLRIMDFPVYISGKSDPTLTPLVPTS